LKFDNLFSVRVEPLIASPAPEMCLEELADGEACQCVFQLGALRMNAWIVVIALGSFLQLDHANDGVGLLGEPGSLVTSLRSIGRRDLDAG
jgi:hypothetical protein